MDSQPSALVWDSASLALQLRRIGCVWLIAFVLAAAGCGDDDPTGPPPGGDDLPEVTTPDVLAALFVTALNELDLALYEHLLHDDYAYQFPLDEFDLAGTANGRWPRDRDLAAMTRLMQGSPSRDGEVVQSIDGQMTANPIPWNSNVEPEFIGAQRRTYTMRMDVDVSGGTIYQVRGEHEFYVIQVGEVWELLFYRDNGVELTKRRTEESSFGAVKAAYVAAESGG